VRERERERERIRSAVRRLRARSISRRTFAGGSRDSVGSVQGKAEGIAGKPVLRMLNAFPGREGGGGEFASRRDSLTYEAAAIVFALRILAPRECARGLSETAPRRRVCKISRFVIGLFFGSRHRAGTRVTISAWRRTNERFALPPAGILREGRSRDRARSFSLETPVVHSRRVHRAKTIAIKRGITSRQSIRPNSSFTRIKAILQLYIYVCIHTYYIYIYIYRGRVRDGDVDEKRKERNRR